MATTKTLTPTNQAITLAAFTEKPDNRTNVTNDDKLADAVNALNSNMPSNYFLLSNGGTKISGGANLNNYTTPGCYYIEFASDATSIQNIPFADAGMLFVRNTIPVSGRKYKQQIFMPFSTDDVYRRHTMDNGETWSEWKSDNVLASDVSNGITDKSGMEFAKLYVIPASRIAILQYRSKGATSISNGGVICTMPTAYKPAANTDCTGICWLSSGATSGVSVPFTARVMNSDGKVYALHPLNQAMYGHSGIAIWIY